MVLGQHGRVGPRAAAPPEALHSSCSSPKTEVSFRRRRSRPARRDRQGDADGQRRLGVEGRQHKESDASRKGNQAADGPWPAVRRAPAWAARAARAAAAACGDDHGDVDDDDVVRRRVAGAPPSSCRAGGWRLGWWGPSSTDVPMVAPAQVHRAQLVPQGAAGHEVTPTFGAGLKRQPPTCHLVPACQSNSMFCGRGAERL